MKQYKATVFLNPGKINFVMPKDQSIAIPMLETGLSTDKDFVLEYVKELHRQGIICAYRISYCLDDKINNFYMDSDVVYFSEEHKSIPRVPGFIRENYKK